MHTQAGVRQRHSRGYRIPRTFATRLSRKAVEPEAAVEVALQEAASTLKASSDSRTRHCSHRNSCVDHPPLHCISVPLQEPVKFDPPPPRAPPVTNCFLFSGVPACSESLYRHALVCVGFTPIAL